MSTTPAHAVLTLLVCLVLAPGAVAGAPLDDTENTTDGVEGTVNDTVENTTETVERTADDAVGAVEQTTNDAIETLEATADSDAVTETADTLQRDDRTVAIETVVTPSRDSGGVDSVASEEPPSADSPLLTEADAPSGGAEGTDDEESPGPAPGLPPGGIVGGIGLAGLAAVALRQGAVVPGGVTMVARNAATSATVAGSDTFERLLRTFYPLRYSRHDDSDPLEHEARVEMLDVIESTPGTYLTEVAERAGLPLSTARHHMRVLEREGLVASAKVRGKRRFYPGNADGLELAAAMNDAATARLLDALVRSGPSSVSTLAAELDRDPSTITHHLKRLEEDGVVVRERDGRTIVNRLSPDAAEALEPDPEPAPSSETVASAD